jgi:hypothetical protein
MRKLNDLIKKAIPTEINSIVLFRAINQLSNKLATKVTIPAPYSKC